MLLWLYKCRRLREKSSTDIVRRGRIRKRKKWGKKMKKKKKSTHKSNRPTWQWMMFADGPQWRRSTLALQPQILRTSIRLPLLPFFFSSLLLLFLFFSSFFLSFFYECYLARASSLSLFIFPARETSTSILAKYIHCRTTEERKKMFSPHISFLFSLQHTDAFIHKHFALSFLDQRFRMASIYRHKYTHWIQHFIEF